ncbi:MAG: hypothetical protein JSV86_03535 [Gemmatimonadota bacterium]|nr:MAG: hypothetical protein JSV86_03535 [Gemmatimonadota bacterium]
MSHTSSSDTWPVTLMRWAARFLSVPWALWTLFFTLWVVVEFEGDEIGLAVAIIIMVIATVLFLGAALIASVWGKEALGGGVLLVDGALIVLCFLTVPHVDPSLVQFFTPSELPFNFTMVLPPLVAGSLFLACHRITKPIRTTV